MVRRDVVFRARRRDFVDRRRALRKGYNSIMFYNGHRATAIGLLARILRFLIQCSILAPRRRV